MADVPDSKSGPRKRVWVQVPPSVLKRSQSGSTSSCRRLERTRRRPPTPARPPACASRCKCLARCALTGVAPVGRIGVEVEHDPARRRSYPACRTGLPVGRQFLGCVGAPRRPEGGRSGGASRSRAGTAAEYPDAGCAVSAERSSQTAALLPEVLRRPLEDGETALSHLRVHGALAEPL
jgi:hypothetical protein